MIYSLDSRCINILKRLLHTNGYTTVQEIADMEQISKRSVYYDLSKINEWLEQQDVEIIEVERKKGVFVTQSQIEKINVLIKEVNESTFYLFSPMERVDIIICTIMKKLKPMIIEDFMNVCQVSRNTIINDLKAVTSKLQEYNLQLEYANKQGYQIKGDIIRKRTVFFLLFSNLVDYYQKGILKHDDEERVLQILNDMRLIESELHTSYVPGTLYTISVFFASIHKRSESLVFSDMDKSEIEDTKEYQLVCKYFKALADEEKYYLALHLLGSRMQSVPMHLLAEKENESTYELARNLVSEFSRIACMAFPNVEEVEQSIYAHLKTSLYRYRYGIQLGNPLLSDIKNEYNELFELTKKACEYLKQQIGVPIPDGEIAYLTLHFGGFMNKSEINRQLNILIVCPNGIGTGNMLRREVINLLPNADKVDVVALNHLEEVKNYQLVISTVPIEGVRSTVVHPILTDIDRVSILRESLKDDSTQQMEVESIINIAKNYVDEEKLKLFKEDISNYFSSMKVKQVRRNDFGLGLEYYLNQDHIFIFEKEYTWEESFVRTSQILIKKGSIAPHYVKSMIEKTKQMGPYMFICEGVVLAHAQIEDGAYHTDIALGLFKQSVRFDKGRDAHIVLVLSAEDQTKHIHILNDIMNIFQEDKNVKILKTCENVEQLQKQLFAMIKGSGICT